MSAEGFAPDRRYSLSSPAVIDRRYSIFLSAEVNSAGRTDWQSVFRAGLIFLFRINNLD